MKSTNSSNPLSVYIPTQSPEEDWKWSYAKSPGWQPTLCVAWCLICWFALAYKKYGHTWHQMSLLRPGVIKQHKPNQTTKCRDFHTSPSFLDKQNHSEALDHYCLGSHVTVACADGASPNNIWHEKFTIYSVFFYFFYNDESYWPVTDNKLKKVHD